MRIANNISAMNTHRTLMNADNQMSKSMERLSSGYRINKAADDAAGLAISEKMRAQVRGLNQASSNAQDGISMIQTAEGGLNEMHSILQRMRELAVQAGNDTLTSSDKDEIQKEITQLVDEVDRISEDTEFNTKKLLNGEAGTSTNSYTGVVAGGNLKINGSQYSGATTAVSDTNLQAATTVKAGSDTQTGVYTVAISQFAAGATVGDASGIANTNVSGTLKVNGVDVQLDSGTSMANIVLKINNVTNQTGVTAASGSVSGGLQLTSNEVGSSQTISVQGSAALMVALGLQDSGATATALTDAGQDVLGTINGVTATGKDNTLTLSSDGNAADGVSVEFDASKITAGTGATLSFQAAVDPNGQVNLQIGANSNQTITFSISNMSTASLDIDDLDVTSNPDDALDKIDSALSAVSSERSKLGAYQNRLEHTISNLGVSAENITASESRIRDVDMASEMAQFTKNQILTQASTSMLAQANQKSQSVLKLLG